jgi:hypothetical protein
LRKRLAADEKERKGLAAPSDLEGEIVKFSQSTVCDKSELFWPAYWVNFIVGEIFRIVRRFLSRRNV